MLRTELIEKLRLVEELLYTDSRTLKVPEASTLLESLLERLDDEDEPVED